MPAHESARFICCSPDATQRRRGGNVGHKSHIVNDFSQLSVRAILILWRLFPLTVPSWSRARFGMSDLRASCDPHVTKLAPRAPASSSILKTGGCRSMCACFLRQDEDAANDKNRDDGGGNRTAQVETAMG